MTTPSHREFTLPLIALLVTGLFAGIATADPPRPGTEENGLSENESATLWSRDTDTYITQAEYRDRYGTTRSAVHQTANGTDIAFTRPPETAATWTRNDFTDLESGGSDTSVHPPDATLRDGTYITDAHATIFSVQPSTRGHITPDRTPLYVAPNGTVRGFVDYRVRVPDEDSSDHVEWDLVEHEIESVRLRSGSETIASTTGTDTPVLAYQLADNWDRTLSIEADIDVRLKRTVRPDGTGGSATDVTYHTDSVTVSDSIDVQGYDPTITASYAEYPNGDSGVAMFNTQPWQGYSITADGESRVRGVWRFYTARDTTWDTLVRSTRTGSSEVESDALPVYVHAYPSRIGPRAEPVRDGPEIVRSWGSEQQSPRATIGENVTVDVVNDTYTTTYGIATRSKPVDRETVAVTGIVRGENATIETEGQPIHVRNSTLSVTIHEQNASQATIRVKLQDARTGDPIVLNGSEMSPSERRVRTGYISIADQQVQTNRSGVAIVRVDQPGMYTAQYHPGSWVSHEPAYVGSTAAVRWHPLTTIDGWFRLFLRTGLQLLPFAVMLYAGIRLRRLLGPDEFFDS